MVPTENGVQSLSGAQAPASCRDAADDGTVVRRASTSRHSTTETETGRRVQSPRDLLWTIIHPDVTDDHAGPNSTVPSGSTRAARSAPATSSCAPRAAAIRCRKGSRYPGASRPSGIGSGAVNPAPSANRSASATPTSTGPNRPETAPPSQTVAQGAAGRDRRASHSAAQPASSAKPQCRPAPRAALSTRALTSDGDRTTASVVSMKARPGKPHLGTG
jgi:hypothetical protein